MFTLFLISIGSIGIVVLTSIRHHSRVEKYLATPLKADQKLQDKVAKEFDIIETAAVGATIFDILYNTAKMDPFALAGMNHLHHSQNFQNLGDLISYMKENIISADHGSTAWWDIIHKYKGYTGEEIAFSHISESGHSVDLPESGTNPEFDAAVQGPDINGEINVKVTDNPSYIQSHLDRHSDIPVYTNTEMNAAFLGNSHVIIDPELSTQDAFNMTDSTFRGITDLGAMLDNIPIITLAVSSIKNTAGAITGKKTIIDALEHTAEDTAGVGFGGWAGSKVGLALGLALAPVTGGTSAIVIPALTTTLISIVGIFVGKRITNWIKTRHLRKTIGTLKSDSAKFYSVFIEKFEIILHDLAERYSTRISKCESAYIRSENWFKRILYPSVMSKFYRIASKQMGDDSKAHCDYYKQFRETIEPKNKDEGGLMIYSQGIQFVCGVSPLPELWMEVEKGVTALAMEKQRIK